MSNLKPEATVKRTSVSASGAVTDQQIPLSSQRKDAMDLSDNPQASLLVTREAAMRITERAITTALVNTWPNFVRKEETKSTTPAGASSSSNKKMTKNSQVSHNDKKNKNKSKGTHDDVNHELGSTKSAPGPATNADKPLNEVKDDKDFHSKPKSKKKLNKTVSDKSSSRPAVNINSQGRHSPNQSSSKSDNVSKRNMSKSEGKINKKSTKPEKAQENKFE